MVEGVREVTTALPAPDPTKVTSKVIKEALRAERHLTSSDIKVQANRHDADIAGIKGKTRVIVQRLDDIDKAQSLLAETVNKVPSETDLKTGQLRELLHAADEGLRQLMIGEVKGIYAVLGEREKRTTEAAALADTALKAAFKAQQDAATEQNKANEKAIAVSADATAKTILKNEQLAFNGLASAEARQNELKDSQTELRTAIASGIADLRSSITFELNTLRTQVTTIASTRAGGTQNQQALYAVGALILTVITILISVYAITKK